MEVDENGPAATASSALVRGGGAEATRRGDGSGKYKRMTESEKLQVEMIDGHEQQATESGRR